MKIHKYTDDDGKVKFDLQGISEYAFAAIVEAMRELSNDNSKGVLSSNADGFLRVVDTFERANVDDAILRATEGKL